MSKKAKRRVLLAALAVSLLPWSLAAQNLNISGVVTGATGEAVAGASVVVKGMTTGVITGVNGDYTISAPADAVLQFSMTGMGNVEEAVGGRGRVDVVLPESLNELDALVVIGYGTVRKRDLIGSVASVKADDITALPTADAVSAIQGKVAGVDIMPTSGEAGADMEILIRGSRSINASNKPLIIIDGVQGGKIEDLNPSDIASLEILKDASSTAIYGAQGANGVVIVTTKKGQEGKTTVSYDGYYGVNGVSKYPKVLTGDKWVKWRTDAYAYNGKTPVFTPEEQAAIDAGQWVNWVDEVMETGTQQSHSVSVRSGSEKTKSFISGGYFEQQGLFYNDKAERFTARVNLDHTVNKWVKVGATSNLTYWNKNRRTDMLSSAAITTPLGTPYDEEGNIVDFPVPGVTGRLSPLADNKADRAVDHNKALNASVSAYLDITPFEGLNFRSIAGGNFNFSRRGIFNDDESIARFGNTALTRVENPNSQFYTWDNVLNYKKEFGVHSLNLTALTSWTRRVDETFSMQAPGQNVASYLFYNIADADRTNSTLASNYKELETMSYAGRVDYNLMGKYLFTASLRADGASPLAAGNKWAYFPAVGAAWRAIDEDFMSGVRGKVSELKVRLNYGITGNAAVDPYATQDAVTTGDNLGFGDIPAPTYAYGTLKGNRDLSWERSAVVDFGIDLGLFNSRVNLTADVYSTKTTDLIMKRTLPTSSGGTSKETFQMWQNVGETSNKGVELSLNTVNVQQKGEGGFRWTSTLTFSANKEKIDKMYNGDYIAPTDTEWNTLLEGHPVKSFYNYKKIGIWQIEEAEEAKKWKYNGITPEPGFIKFANVDSVNYDISTSDRTFVGQQAPKWLLGFNNTFTYKGFDLNVYMFVRWGQSINYELAGRYNPQGYDIGANGQSGMLDIYDYWTPTNPTNDYPAANSERRLIDYPGYLSLNVIDGSYFKLKTITLGYTLPSKWTSKIKIEKLRVYCTANNLLTVAKSHLLKDYDPERRGSGSSPMSRQFVFGVNLDF